MASQVEDIKWLPNAATNDKRFLVDGFNFKTRACRHYILTHFHSDHTCGLTKGLAVYGFVYTSEVTARLLVHDMGFPAAAVVALPLHAPFMLEGCRVRLLDANHCPGAVMVLVEVVEDREGRPLPKPCVILHTGDCRWEDRLADHIPPGLQIDTLFLDTTYSIPRYTFPPQSAVIDALEVEVRDLLAQQPNSLLVVAAYHIGKEKVFLNLAHRLGLKVWCSDRKRRVLQQLGLPEAHMALLTSQAAEAQLHVSGWGGMRPDQLQQRYIAQVAAAAGITIGPPDSHELGEDGATGTEKQDADEADGCGADAIECVAGDDGQVVVKQEEGGDRQATGVENAQEEHEEVQAAALVKGQGHWTHVIAIRATGWSFRKKARNLIARWVSGHVTLLSAPYSEHSSFAELCSCVKLLRPSRIIPTANAPNAAAAKAIVERFVQHMDLSRQRGRLDMYLRKPSAGLRTPEVCPPPPTAATPGTGTLCAVQPAGAAACFSRSAAAETSPQAAAMVTAPAAGPQADVVRIDLTLEEEEEMEQRQGDGEPGGEAASPHQSGPCPAQGVEAVGASDAALHSGLLLSRTPVQVAPPASSMQDGAMDVTLQHEEQQQVEEQPQQQHMDQQADASAYVNKGAHGGTGAAGLAVQVAQVCDGEMGQQAAGQQPAAGMPELQGGEVPVVAGVDVAEQQRIWDMIRAECQHSPNTTPAQLSHLAPGTATASRPGPRRSQSGGTSARGSAASRANVSAKAGRSGSAGTPSGKGHGSRSTSVTPAAKRARVSAGPAGTRADPLVLDMPEPDLVAGSSKAAANRQSSIRTFFMPAGGSK